MELQKIDRVDSEPLEGAHELRPRGLLPPLPYLRGQKEALAVFCQPRGNPCFGDAVPVARGNIDMVDTVFAQHGKSPRRIRFADFA